MAADGASPAAYCTAEIDFLATGGGNAFVPANANFYYIAERMQVLVTQRTGAATGNLVFQSGNDGSESNLTPVATIGSAQINAAAAPVNPSGNGANQTVTTAVATAGYTLKITTALTGSSVCKGKIVIFGAWVPQ